MTWWQRQCDAKHHIDAYLMVKVWTYGIDVSLQSSLPMPRAQDGRDMAQAGCQSCHLHS